MTTRILTRGSRYNEIKKEEEDVVLADNQKRFWIEVAWNIGVEDGKDCSWSPSSKSRCDVRENLVWWPAFTETESFQDNLYNLWYSQTHKCTSTKDIDVDGEHIVSFLLGDCLKHVEGSEAGKVCTWRYANWSEDLDVDKDESLDARSDIDELRGCFLELQQQLREEVKRNDVLRKTVTVLDERMVSKIEDLSSTRLKLFIAKSITNGLEIRGKECRHPIECNSYSNDHRQTFPRLRAVDCTLHEFRDFARETELSLRNKIEFHPSLFRVCGFSMRQKSTLSIHFESFQALCDSLNMNNNVSCNLMFQCKDRDGPNPSIQIIGHLLEFWKNEKVENPYEYVPECIILPGGSVLHVRNRKGKGLIITRPAGSWHEQSCTCDKQFSCISPTAEDIRNLLDIHPDVFEAQYENCFKLEWEPLKEKVPVTGRELGENSFLGNVNVRIPVVHIRTRRIIEELESIFVSFENNRTEGYGWYGE